MGSFDNLSDDDIVKQLNLEWHQFSKCGCIDCPRWWEVGAVRKYKKLIEELKISLSEELERRRKEYLKT